MNDFLNLNINFNFKFIENDRMLIMDSDKKFIVTYNEVFLFQNDFYVILNQNLESYILYEKMGKSSFFCFLSYGFHGFKNVLLSQVFFQFIFKLNKIIFLKNKKIIIIIIMIFLIPFFLIKSNVIYEDVSLVQDRYLTQRKIYIGYMHMLRNYKETNIKEEISDDLNNIEEIAYNPEKIYISKRKNSYKNHKINDKKSKIDKDTEFFLKMNSKNKKNKYDNKKK
ncbi:hypothetical protein AXG55_09205 [Silvanigrella aquatica]|uniref:Uncharacterized protein n=2 Tax=Silvanigrella aquatica TaxID=1915309 RepID=A0A1L4D1J1_9BACT|nr:hypothetical protein AXG55_09205 [Silvanigrella aquatica]